MPRRTRPPGPPPLLTSVEPAPASTRLRTGMLADLQAFDAAARLGSFGAAADALRITASAVSHRIRGLERELQTPLFARLRHGVEPTGPGRRLAVATGRAFAELARATAASEISPRRLRLAVSPFFATAWLIPRLPNFMTAHPDIELIIEQSTRPLDLDAEPLDAAIRIGDGQWGELTAQRLMAISTTPVIAVALKRRLGLAAPADLVRAPLIHVTSFPLAWPAWLEGAGAAGVEPAQSVWVDSFGAALQAAEAGVGVALALEPLASNSARAGPLERPFAFCLPTGAYWLLLRREDQRRPSVRAFARWLVETLAYEGAGAAGPPTA